MKTGYSKQIQERINGADVGTIFMNSDFADIADSETIRRNLNRLTKIGMLRRILTVSYTHLDVYKRQAEGLPRVR